MIAALVLSVVVFGGVAVYYAVPAAQRFIARRAPQATAEDGVLDLGGGWQTSATQDGSVQVL